MADADTSINGFIYYRETNSGLEDLSTGYSTAFVNEVVSFTSAFVATWFNVAYQGGDEERVSS